MQAMQSMPSMPPHSLIPSSRPERPLVLPRRKPFPVQPPVEKVQAGFGLVQRDHMPSRMDPHERQVAAALDLADLPTRPAQSQRAEGDLVISLLPGPLQRFRPAIITQPVADEVRVPLHRVSQEPVIADGFTGPGIGELTA